MKKEISPAVAIGIVVVVLLILGGIFYYNNRDRGADFKPMMVNGHKALPHAAGMPSGRGSAGSNE